ncbi:MAG TPA: elongation factor G [Holophaga sp.]|nr:elongation factor G [Holophaga sp.]
MLKSPSAPRVAAFVGPYTSGKTSLLESLLYATQAIPRKGTVKEGNTVGDPSPEAKARQMSVEISAAETSYLNEKWSFIDCPGSVEFMQDTYNALMVVDAAVVVCDADPARALMASTILKFLDDHQIPHVLFLNKVDLVSDPAKIRETVQAIQAVSQRPLLLREYPVSDGKTITGFVDLASERAFEYQPGQDAKRIEIPASIKDDVAIARQEMLEALGNLDDALLEKLLEEQTPTVDEIFPVLTRGDQKDEIVQVLFGSADKDLGIERLLKLLRHEAPEPSATAARLNIPESATALAQVFKTSQAQHLGKQSWIRVWRGEIAEGHSFNGVRPSSMTKLFGSRQEKLAKAVPGELASLGRMDPVKTGDVLVENGNGNVPELAWLEPMQPMTALALHTIKSGDEVKLSAALAKLIEEDPSFRLEQNQETQERVFWGRGEIHLKNAVERLKTKYNVEVRAERPQVPYRETIKKGCEVRGRHKRQTGGHGQFGDVHFRIKPLPRGGGVVFTEEIVGGVVPRNFIPAVEDGVRDYCKQGPLGFPVVDLSVCLFFGSYHDVDSSEMAFKTAARIGMQEGLVQCSPVLLEPILEIHISVPSEFTSKAQRLVTGHRGGQILGFDAKPDWPGWDVVEAYLPQSEMQDVIVELRSQTLGVGHFTWAFHHLQELEGRDADKVIEARKKAIENAHG